MKLISKIVLTVMFLAPTYAMSLQQTTAKPAQTTTAPSKATPTEVTVNEVDSLKLENAFLKATLAANVAKNSESDATKSKDELISLIHSYETKYNATFDTTTGKFISKPAAK